MRTYAGKQKKPPAGVVRVSIERDDGHGTKAILGLTVCVALVSVIGLAILGYDSPRQWVGENVGLSLVGAELIALITVLAALTIWSRNRTRAERAVALALIACPTALIGLGTAWALLPPTGTAIAIRCVVVIVFSVTPAIMWWLFLASQRASLLNEFLANLERLGLLEMRDKYRESEAAQHTRIASYLQRFEGNYGRLSEHVHRDVIAGKYKNYSSDDVPTLRPTSTAAVPVFLATVVFAVGWLIALPPIPLPAVVTFEWADALVPTIRPVTFAFLGAYFFAIQMLFRRYVRSDLRGSAYVAIVMRVALAVIGIWALTGIVDATTFNVTQSQLCLLGFVIGVFPVVVWRVIRSVSTKLFVFAVPNLESKYTLDGLDGLTVWHQSRLEEEDVENIPNMATADIVDLLVNTRFPAGRIVDWVDQAILLTYLRESSTESGPATAELARHGVRTASSLLRVDAVRHADLDWFGDPAEPGSPDVRSLIAAVQTSPNLSLVLRWRGRPNADNVGAGHPDTERDDSPPVRTTTPPRQRVATGVAMASTLLLAAGRLRARRRTVVTDPHG